MDDSQMATERCLVLLLSRSRNHYPTLLVFAASAHVDGAWSMEHGVWSMEYELGACTGIAIPAANANANATATTTESFWVSDLRSVISVRSTTN